MATDPAKRQTWALAAGCALMLAWGVNFAITKVVLAELGVWPFLFVRFLPVISAFEVKEVLHEEKVEA